MAQHLITQTIGRVRNVVIPPTEIVDEMTNEEEGNNGLIGAALVSEHMGCYEIEDEVLEEETEVETSETASVFMGKWYWSLVTNIFDIVISNC